MAQGEGSRNLPSPESTKPGGGAQTPPEKPFQDQINNLPPDKLMELFRKATGGVLNQSDQGQGVPAADKRSSKSPEKPNDVEDDKGVDSHPNLFDQIKAALKGPNDLRLDKTSEEIQRAAAILKEAGVAESEPKLPRLLNAVMAAEEILNQSGNRKKAIINDEGKFVDITNFAEAILKKAGIEAPNSEQINKLLTAPELLGKPQSEREIIDQKTGKRVDLVNLWKEEIRGHKQFGGEPSEEYALELYQVAEAFQQFIEASTDPIFINPQVQLSIAYYKQGIEAIEKHIDDLIKKEGIDKEKAMHVNDGLRADLYYKVGNLGHYFDRKSALPYAQQSARIYADIYNRKGPQEVLKDPKLHHAMSFAFIQYAESLRMNGQIEKSKLVELQRFELEKGRPISRVP